jgi:CRISPR-associated protein Cmr1
MFMAGAETKTNPRSGREEPVPELRAASVKGCMRFIWRAIQRADDIGRLREEEGGIFGNAYGGDKTKASAMRVRIESVAVSAASQCMVPHRKLEEYDGSGKPFPAAAVLSGSTFDVILTSFGDETKHKNYVRLFALTCLLYGFGRRSRKGFGTVVITGADGTGREIDRTLDGIADNLNALSLFGAKYSWADDTKTEIVANGGAPAGYPYIENIRVAGTPVFADTELIIGQIGMAAHHNKGKAFLGAATPRYASSLLLSTAPWDDKNYCCIVTQLHCTNAFNPADRDTFYQELDGRV